MTRKTCAIILAVLLVAVYLCVFPCSSGMVSGLENFNTETCSVGLTGNLFPDNNFLNSYQYIDGDYEYQYEDCWDGSGYSAVFACMHYSESEYEAAKKYCLDRFQICEDHQYVYGGFEWAEHLHYTVKNAEGERSIGCVFPRRFNLFAYNDQNCTLLFLGYYNANSTETSTFENDFDYFIESVFPLSIPFK